MSFWSELRAGRSCASWVAYGVAAWLIIEVATALEEPLGLPAWTDTLVIVLLGLGFFIAAILAWAFDVTPAGVRRTGPAPTHAKVPPGAPLGRYAGTAAAAALVGAATVWLFTRDSDVRWLNEIALPQVDVALAQGDWQAAFASAMEIEGRLPGSRELEELWPRMAWTTSIRSEPAGARVFRRPYAAVEDSWEQIGVTPLEDLRVPFGVSELRLELEGHATIHRTVGSGMVNLPLGDALFRLEAESEAYADKVLVPGFTVAAGDEAITVNDYYLGRYEVTNQEFKEFVDDGGYQLPGIWEPFVENGRTLSWDEGIARFVDATGQQGPSGWQAGDYPPDQGDQSRRGRSAGTRRWRTPVGG